MLIFYDMGKKILKKSGYDWQFVKIGGITRVSITKGEDLAHLEELDRKLWTVLSCPATGIEFDKTTLSILDSDNDGKIRVDEVISAANWITKVIKNKEELVLQKDSVPLSSFNIDDEQGKSLHDSAKQILYNLRLDKDSISIADTSDSVAIFAKTRFNGDGVITPATSDDERIKDVINACIKTIGSVADRSGEAGVNAELIEKFYSECDDYAAWLDAATLPYGDETEKAYSLYQELKAKIDDWFMRCKLAAFSSESTEILDVNKEKIGAISDLNLSDCVDKVAAYPIAKVNSEAVLPVVGINPAWKDKFDAFKAIAFSDAVGLNEDMWKEIESKFGPYTSWIGSKKGLSVEALGAEAIESFSGRNQKDEILTLIEEDKSVKEQAEAIDEVNKAVHLYCYFFQFVKNFVTFSDFYSRDEKRLAMFQAGRLFIEQRCCELCIKVEDMGKQADMAALSGMYILYCKCVSKVKGETINIAAALTDGDVNALREGKNGVFYDRNGLDWDATVIKIIDNPVSILQAFWSPYRKLARFVEKKLTKSVEDKDAEMNTKLITAVDTKDGEKAKPFDIAKFAGIFAAIGMAIGYLTSGLGKILESISDAKLAWWQYLVILACIMLVISGPAMISAWLKLRKRNIAPVLNANGWAINSIVLVNIGFGATFTKLAKYPKITMPDPFQKKTSPWTWILLILVVAAAACLYFVFRP